VNQNEGNYCLGTGTARVNFQDCAAGKCCEREANAFSGSICKNHGLKKSHCEPRVKNIKQPGVAPVCTGSFSPAALCYFPICSRSGNRRGLEHLTSYQIDEPNLRPGFKHAHGIVIRFGMIIKKLDETRTVQ